MSLAPEAVQSERDLERKHQDSAARESPVLDTQLDPLGNRFGGFGVSGSDDTNSKLVSSPLLQRRANGEMRIQIMRRFQQGAGNHKAQQLVAQLRRSSVIQRECACGGTCSACQGKAVDEEESPVLQREPSGAGTDGGVVDAGVIPVDSPGQPLDRSTREFMEPRLGSDFSDVRIHTDASAAQSASALAADAYTTGRDIYFAAGKYAPASRDGQHLIAHELTHTVQQGNGADVQVAAKHSSKLIVTDPGDHLEQEAERAANKALSPEKPERSRRPGSISRPGRKPPTTQLAGTAAPHAAVRGPVASSPPGIVQRQPADTPEPETDDPALDTQLNEEIDTWQSDIEQDADLMLRALASRMVLLLKWNTHPLLRTEDDLDSFTAQCDAAAKTEMDTLNAFSPAGAELALQAYPQGFPLTWSGRVQDALTIGADPIAILGDYLKALTALKAQADALPPAILAHGLPVSLDQIDRLKHFSLAMGLSSKDSEVRDYARESLRYVQLKWVMVFAFTWEKTVDSIAADVADGKTVIKYADYLDFVQNKQAILRSLPERARGLPTSLDDVQQMQDDSVSLKDAALLVGVVSALASIFGGIFGGWDEASSFFEEAKSTADAGVAGADGGDRLIMAMKWAWANDYFSGAALAQVQALIDNGPKIMAEIAFIIILQAIPGVDVALDVYLAITLGLDVIGMIDDLGSALSRTMNASTVSELQQSSVRLAELFTSVGIQILMALGIKGIGKAAARVRKGAAELRAADKTLTEAAAEKKALEGLSAEERAPLDQAADKVNKFDKSLENRYSPETQPILDTPGVRAKLATVSEDARRLIELCDSPCLPPAHQLLEADLSLLEKVQKRLGRPGYDRDLKEFFYNRRSAPGGLKQAIEDLNGVKKADLEKFLSKEAKAAQKLKIDEAKELIDDLGAKTEKFADQSLEDRYQRYRERKKSIGQKPRSRADWKVASDFWTTDSPMARGNAFDRAIENRKIYPYNQVGLEGGFRLDSYDPLKGEIISRKATDFDVIDPSTFKGYLEELKQKYSAGTKIRSDKYKTQIDGQALRGKQFLEVPKSNEASANRAAFEAAAKAEGITIRYREE
jgi:hypothetical protein